MSPEPGLDRRVRQPVWSGLFTHGLAARIPPPVRPLALTMIKAIHTVIFASIAALVAAVAWDGVRGLPRRRTAFAAAVAIAESIVYASNNRVCPLTPLAEELGAANGSVTDMFLPEAVSRLIPAVAGSALGVGLVLNIRALQREDSTSR
jgi:hypothetical protein